MKSRESLVRLKEFQVKEKRRQLSQLQMMMAEFERMAKELENQIAIEEKKSGISDPNHFAYPTFCQGRPPACRQPSGLDRELKVQQDAAELSLRGGARPEFRQGSRAGRARQRGSHPRLTVKVSGRNITGRKCGGFRLCLSRAPFPFFL